MDFSEPDLMARVAREVKRISRQHRVQGVTPDFLAMHLVQDPQIYEAACLWGDSPFRVDASGKTIVEPDLDLIASWARRAFREERVETSRRRIPYKLHKFCNRVRKTYSVTNQWITEEGRYYIL